MCIIAGMKPHNLILDTSCFTVNSFGRKQYHIDSNNINLFYIPGFLDIQLADTTLKTLLAELPWQQPTIRIAGKQIPIPRKQAWLGDRAFDYTYSGQRFTAQKWHPAIVEIKQRIETQMTEQVKAPEFNSALCNLYRDGQDSVSWHSDDEPELGPKPIIASYSLGQTRRFLFRDIKDPAHKYQILLNHNDLLVMGQDMQSKWQHQLPKTKLPMLPRINLTFRHILNPRMRG